MVSVCQRQKLLNEAKVSICVKGSEVPVTILFTKIIERIQQNVDTTKLMCTRVLTHGPGKNCRQLGL